MTFPSEIDVAIIGAGAAGIAAARALEGSDLSVLILEARDRVGGRGHTVILPNDIPFDLGCGWLHCHTVAVCLFRCSARLFFFDLRVGMLLLLLLLTILRIDFTSLSLSLSLCFNNNTEKIILRIVIMVCVCVTVTRQRAECV